MKDFMKSKIFNVLFLMISMPVHAMEESNSKKEAFYSIILPGQNGGGGASFTKNNIVNTDHFTQYETLENQLKIDLGQGNCIQNFEKQLDNDEKVKDSKLLLYGISQGTATLVNFLAKKSHTEQEEKIGCLFLEAVLGSGNNAILHTIQSTMSPWITSAPFARFWLPWVAKVFYPTYNPYGKQAFSSAKKISPNIPIVIMHNKGDTQLTINDARKLYCILSENNNNVYLFETNNRAKHFDILEGAQEKIIKIAALQTIYKKHNLPYEEPTTEIDLATYQPTIKNVQKIINNATQSDYYVRNTIDFIAASIVLPYLAYFYYNNPSI